MQFRWALIAVLAVVSSRAMAGELAGNPAGGPAPASAAEISMPTADPIALYGPEATYDIFRNGSRVGTHRIRFSRAGDTIEVESLSSIELRLLVFSAYEFSYAAQSRWESGKLVTLEARTDDDGALSLVRVRTKGNTLTIDGPAGTIDIPQPLPVSEHWSRAFIDDDRQINTITGAINDISVTALGSASVPSALGTARAERFRIDGDLALETWYDDSGRWLGMRFKAEDGSDIEYRCRICRADLAVLADDIDTK